VPPISYVRTGISPSGSLTIFHLSLALQTPSSWSDHPNKFDEGHEVQDETKLLRKHYPRETK
jgi:hypothetical protein